MFAKAFKVWIGALILGFGTLCKVHACDGCSLFSGVTPMDLKSQAGLNFRYRPFAGFSNMPMGGSGKTQHDPGDPSAHPEALDKYRENYHRISLNLRWFFLDRWNIQASVPFTANNERWPEGSKRGAGLSDITLAVNHGLIVKNGEKQSVRIFVGGGVKLPSGWQFRNLVDRRQFFDIQGTTETLDFILQSDASWRFGSNGFLNSLNFRINTQNSNGIRYGNFFNWNLNFFRQFSLAGGKVNLLPYTGVYLEAFSGRQLNKERVYWTGGEMLFANLGLHCFTGRMGFQPQIQIPLAQRLNGVQLKSQSIASLNVNYFF